MHPGTHVLEPNLAANQQRRLPPTPGWKLRRLPSGMVATNRDVAHIWKQRGGGLAVTGTE